MKLLKLLAILTYIIGAALVISGAVAIVFQDHLGIETPELTAYMYGLSGLPLMIVAAMLLLHSHD